MATMETKILYAGDDSLDRAASYLAAILSHARFAFDYVAGDEPLQPALGGAEHSLYIISDYPVKNLRGEDFRTLDDRVGRGVGLLMIGGSEVHRRVC